MESFREDFDNRSGEILAYLDLLKFIENAGAEIVSKKTKKEFFVSSEARKTLKGTIYILLYNLVESTMREAICFIHDELYSKKISFDDLGDGLKKEIIRRIKNSSVNLEQIMNGLKNDISCGITISTFNKKKLFSGNIDKDEIVEKSKIYGFSVSSDYKHTKHGESLFTVKQHRNDLAHGNVSFSEIGKNVSYEDIEIISLEVIAYLDAISENIEKYIHNRNFLAGSS
ncbi:MAE_28990/MAE_18760 family HEPN-like nuclease [Gibbsiella quercinecans]|uniref:MAE_28990/MAE_18760 family HEPN-like nuclease n=1 Tax=Gibbsiella quercinecans TaxID=929813 RepID=UPI003A4D388E